MIRIRFLTPLSLATLVVKTAEEQRTGRAGSKAAGRSITPAGAAAPVEDKKNGGPGTSGAAIWH